MLSLEEIPLKALPASSLFLQTAFWGSFKSRFSWKAAAFRASWKGRPFSFLVLFRRPAFSFPVAYVPHPSFPVKPEEHKIFFSALSRALQAFLPTGTLFVRYDLPPCFEEDPEAEPFAFPCKTGGKIEGLKKSPADIQPPVTLVLSLRQSEEDLLNNMHKKWRYNIRLAAKKGVRIEEGFSREKITSWYGLYQQTAARDKIALHSLSYYQTLFEEGLSPAPENPRPQLFLARHEEDLLAGIITIRSGDRMTYLYGASGDIKRNLMPAYALQWRALREAKAAGCRFYDFFGIPPTDDPAHPMQGLLRFKSGFGGRRAEAPGARDYPYSRVFYGLYTLLERGRLFYYKNLRKRK